LRTRREKEQYDFKLRIAESSKEVLEIPQSPVYLISDGNWHAVTLPIPKMHQGKVVRYFMLLFDHDVEEVIFNSIRFA
jgi:hypothetical protein